MKKGNTKRAQSSTIDWVDVHDDALMVDLGIRCPEYYPVEREERTKQEKKLIKILRRTCKLDDNYFHFEPLKRIPVKAKLIIYLKKNNKYPNTTYSINCWQHNIDQILGFYRQKDKKTGLDTSLVAKYVYNGKTYQPQERPFWY